MPATRQELVAELAACADPARAELGLSRLFETVPDAQERLRASPTLARTVITVMAASPFLTRTCVTGPMALDVLAQLDVPLAPLAPLSRWKGLELLRIAARDLSGEIPLEAVGSALADLADGVLRTATASTGVGDDMAVVAMGKLGARELNYGSDIDIMLVGGGDPHPMLAMARQAWRTDLDLRPEGRAGVLVRSLASYQAYWDRWAETWEFQALLKARPAAGNHELGSAFALEAAKRVWGRPLGTDDLRSLRAMKARAEQAVARHGLTQREIKLGRGGIRDIEFAVQLLQLVHGREDEALRAPGTLSALAALASGGYVANADAEGLASAYRFLRAVEHRLQLFEDRQVHAVPASAPSRAHLARVLGYRDGPSASALARFDADLAHHQTTARTIHERLFFRPLLEAFSAGRPIAGATGAPFEPGPGLDQLLQLFFQIGVVGLAFGQLPAGVVNLAGQCGNAVGQFGRLGGEEGGAVTQILVLLLQIRDAGVLAGDLIVGGQQGVADVGDRLGNGVQAVGKVRQQDAVGGQVIVEQQIDLG